MTVLPKEVERKLAKLAALESGGVDNWEWYGESLKEYSQTIEREENMEVFADEILEIISEGIEEPAGRGCGYGIDQKIQNFLVQFLMRRIKELN